jgi:uncharacterized protein YuzE
MTSKYYRDDDILYLQLESNPITGGHQIDDNKHLDLDELGNICGVVLQGVSDGVDLNGIPAEILAEVNWFLQKSKVRTYKT